MAGLQDGTVLVFSIETATGPIYTYGIVQNYSVNHTTERAEAKGTDGNTVSVQEYDDKIELSLNYLEINGQEAANPIGTAFDFVTEQYGTQSYLISSRNATDTVDGFRSVDITATAYPHLP